MRRAAACLAVALLAAVTVASATAQQAASAQGSSGRDDEYEFVAYNADSREEASGEVVEADRLATTAGYRGCPAGSVPCACGAYGPSHGAYRRHEEQDAQLSYRGGKPRYVDPPPSRHCCCPAPVTCTNTPANVTGGTFTSCPNPTALQGTCTGACSSGLTGNLTATCIAANTWSTSNNCCVGSGQTCSSSSSCCKINAQNATCASSKCCLLDTKPCINASQCCGGSCSGSQQCTCFSGSTLVRTRESPTPVALRNVKTGQHLQCVDASDDMRMPTKLAWCEVHNWAHAKAATFQQIRLSFDRPSGEQGHLTLSSNHVIVKLTNPSLSLGRLEPRVDAFGALDMVPAGAIRPGDKVAVLTEVASAEAGFTAVAITAVDHVEAEGMYAPALDKPFIVADGVVASVWIDRALEVAEGPAGLNSVNKHALYHFLNAPVYMQRFEPIGTPGTASNMTETGEWPGAAPRMQILQQRFAAGDAINYEAVQAWFAPRYAAARSGAAGAPPAASLDDLLALLRSDATWVKQAADGHSRPAST